MSDTPETTYLRKVDFAALDTTPVSERVSQKLIERASGATAAVISYIRTPAGGGSPEGLHVHEVDQHFYVLSGTMNIEVAGEHFEADPGSLVWFPAGVPHRNWNEGEEPTVHLAVNTPLPPEGVPFGRTVG